MYRPSGNYLNTQAPTCETVTIICAAGVMYNLVTRENNYGL